MSWLLDALTRECERADALHRAHDTEYDGGHYVTPSILRDDGKENNGEESPRRGNAALRVPATEA